MSRLGNKMEKGNCCGGYNFHNEDFIWELFRQGYPKHQVEAVTPYTTTSFESYNGLTVGGCSVLYGFFIQNNDLSTNFQMIDQDGIILNIFLLSASPFVTSQPIAAVSVQIIEGVIPSGWQFVGWQVQITGPVIQDGGIEVDFQAMVGGSYPSAIPLPSINALQPLSQIYSQTANVIRLPQGVTTLKVQLTIPRLESGETGIYETYTNSEIQKVFRMAEGQVDVISVIPSGANQIVTLNISNLFNPSTVIFWLDDIAVKFTSESVDYNLEANGLTFNTGGELMATVQIAGAVNASTEGYVKGLALVRNRNIIFATENDTGVDADITAKPFGSPAVSVATAQPGATNPEGVLDVTLYSGILWREPAIELSIGTPA